MSENVVPLKIFIRPERRFVAEGRPTELVVLIRLVPALPPRPEPLPVNFAIVLDGSRSMAGPRLEGAKRGILKLIEAMGPADRLAVVVAGDFVDAAVPSQRVSDPRELQRLVAAIHPAGMSDLYPSWFGGSWEAARHYDRSALNRVIVVTDGGMRARGSSPDTVLSAARGLFRRGVSTSTIGVGDAFSEDILVPLGVQSGGNTSYVTDLELIGERLLDELNGARVLFSEWATLRFDLEGAEVVDVLNDYPWIAQNKLNLPPLYAETPLNLVIRLRLRPGSVGSEITPLCVRVKSLDIEGRQAVVHRKQMKLHVVSSDLADGMGPDLGVQAQAARLEFARMHQKCVRKIDEGDLEGARQILDFSVSRFRALSGQSGGTLLSEDLHEMTRLRERLLREEDASRNRKFFRFSAVFAQRSGFSRPTPPF